MQATNNPQINSRVYWDMIYTSPAKSVEYWERSWRFFKLLGYIKDRDKFLDIGCGVGLPCRMITAKKKDCELWGVDISSEIIKHNSDELPEVKWHQGYVGGLDFIPKNYFDVIFAGEIIEHLDNPLDLFKEAHSFLKKDGKLIITTPVERHIDSPEHLWYLDKKDVENMFLSVGFKNVRFEKLPDTEHLLVFFAIGTK